MENGHTTVDINASHTTVCCVNGHLDVVNALLSTDGIEINQAEKDGATPLSIACGKGHLEVVNALLSTDGIEINQAESMDAHHCMLRAGRAIWKL